MYISGLDVSVLFTINFVVAYPSSRLLKNLTNMYILQNDTKYMYTADNMKIVERMVCYVQCTCIHMYVHVNRVLLAFLAQKKTILS